MNGKRVLGLTLTVMAVAAMGWPVSRAWPEGKAQGGRSDPFEETWKPFFQENCAGCHNAKQAAGARPSLPQSTYAGTWRDPWYGDVKITTRDVQLWLEFTRSPALKGPLEPYDGETFRTRFPDRREEDVLVTFELENGRPVRATMKAVSPDADFSYDFHDLKLTRVQA